MRPELILDPELRRDLDLTRPGRRPRRPMKKATPAHVALRWTPAPEPPAELLAGKDGRRRFLERYRLSNLLGRRRSPA